MKKEANQITLIAFLLAAITVLHYASPWIAHDKYHLALVFRKLYFLPIVLSCLWFDLKGGVIAFCAVFALLLPHLIMPWAGFSAGDITRIMQIFDYLLIAVILGKTVAVQKREQIRAKQAESLAALGSSLAGVAHDMKTPLVAIGGFAGLLKKHLPPGAPDCEKADIIIHETARLESMVKNMLDFSRPLHLNRTQVDIYALVTACLAIVAENTRDQKVVLQTRMAENLPLVNVDEERFRQALINLLINAVQASSQGERVLLHCYRRRKNLALDIIDCGCGIPIEKREAIFSPFFTTKKEGTGLGLPIVKKIIDAHGGLLQIVDNRCGGVTFRITIGIEPAKAS
jgi:signal transduction histidine kinase